MIEKQVLSKLLKLKYFPEYSKEECNKLADLFLRSDFPINGITTYGEAFRFLDYIKGVRSGVKNE